MIEMMAATTILLIIMLTIVSLTQQVSKAWQSSQAKIESFQGVRAGFESMTRLLSQATLNSYYDYCYGNGTGSPPTAYMRKSELHFISGKSLLASSPYLAGSGNQQIGHAIFFQTPGGYTEDTNYYGLDNLMNACGFFITYSDDPDRPSFVNMPNRYRFRLMQFRQPTENLQTYNIAAVTSPTTLQQQNWFYSNLSTTTTRQLAENVIALIINPKRSAEEVANGASLLSTDYEYDTRKGMYPPNPLETTNKLPPMVEVILVAIDEPSAMKLGNSSTAPNLGLSGLFKETAKLEQDLATLEATLNGHTPKITYRIFRTNVPIRAAK